jgi:Flp pilus assembly protein TadG
MTERRVRVLRVIMLRPAALHRGFLASTRGVAAVEFALILPALMVLFLASFDGARAISIYIKVRAATYALDAITNQYSTIASTTMTSIVGATSVVLAPYSSSPAVVTVSQIKVVSSKSVVVSWSYSLNGTALTQGASASVPTNFASCASYSCYLIYGQVTYTYTPMFGYFTKGATTLSDNLYMTPRSSACVLYPPQNVNSC